MRVPNSVPWASGGWSETDVQSVSRTEPGARPRIGDMTEIETNTQKSSLWLPVLSVTVVAVALAATLYLFRPDLDLATSITVRLFALGALAAAYVRWRDWRVLPVFALVALEAAQLLYYLAVGPDYQSQSPLVHALDTAIHVSASLIIVLLSIYLWHLYTNKSRLENAERALRVSERKYRELVENVNSIILRMDMDGNITYFNEYAEKFFGYSFEEVRGRSVIGTIVPERESTGRKLTFMIEDIALDPEAYVTNENENCCKDGQRVWVAWTNKVVRDRDGVLKEILCIGSDVTKRKHVQAALRESEQRFRLLVEQASDAFILHDTEGVILDVNDAACVSLGYSREELMGLTVLELAEKRDSDESEEWWKQLVLGVPVSRTTVFRRQDGSSLPVELHVRLFESEGCSLVLALARDISDWVEAEKALRESETRFRALAESASASIFIVKGEKYAYVNLEFLSLTGYSREEAMGMDFWEIYQPDAQESARERVLDLQLSTWLGRWGRPMGARESARERTLERQGGKDVPSRGEWQFVTKDGHVKWVELTTIAIDYEGATAVLGTGLDITGRKDTERQLKQELAVNAALAEISNSSIARSCSIQELASMVLERARGLTGSLHGFITAIDPQSDKTTCHARTNMFMGHGHSPNDLPRSAFTKNENGQYPALWGHALNSREAFCDNAPSTHPASMETPSSCIPLRRFLSVPVVLGDRLIGQIALANAEEPYDSSSLKVVGMLAELYALIVEELRAERELRREMEVAERESGAKNRLVEDMGRMIRTPMSNIVGMTELLLHAELDEKQKEYAETIRGAARDLLACSSDIWDHLTVDCGSLHIDSVPFDFEEIVGDVGRTIPSAAHRQDVEMIVRYDPGAPRGFKGDPARMRQILAILARSALEVTENGYVLVDVSCRERSDGQAKILVRIEGTGTQIAKGKVDSFLKSFTDMGSAAAHSDRETGQGVAIAKRLIVQMGGTLELGGHMGTKMALAYTLLLTTDEAWRDECSSDTTLQGLRILVVDDRAASCRALAEYLDSWNVPNSTLSSPTEAMDTLRLAQAEGHPFQLVMIDDRMLGVDDVTLADAIGKDDTLQDTKLILLTSARLEPDIERNERHRFVADMEKPVTRKGLFGVLKRVANAEGRDEPLVVVSQPDEAGSHEDESAVCAVLPDADVPAVEDGQDEESTDDRAESHVAEEGPQVSAVTASALFETTASEIEELRKEDISQEERDGEEAAKPDGLLEVEPDGTATGEKVASEPAAGDLEEGIDDYPPVFDAASVLASMRGNVGLMKKTVERVRTDVPKQIDRLRIALDADDRAGVERCVHSIRGAAIGAERLTELAYAMEWSARAGELDIVKGDMPRLEEEARKLETALAGVEWAELPANCQNQGNVGR